MTKRVLIIEDDEQLGAQLQSHLSRGGFATTWLEVGRELEPGELQGVELVVLDLMLPGLSHYAEGVAITGNDEIAELARALDAPALTTPCTTTGAAATSP